MQKESRSLIDRVRETFGKHKQNDFDFLEIFVICIYFLLIYADSVVVCLLTVPLWKSIICNAPFT